MMSIIASEMPRTAIAAPINGQWVPGNIAAVSGCTSLTVSASLRRFICARS